MAENTIPLVKKLEPALQNSQTKIIIDGVEVKNKKMIADLFKGMELTDTKLVDQIGKKLENPNRQSSISKDIKPIMLDNHKREESLIKKLSTNFHDVYLKETAENLKSSMNKFENKDKKLIYKFFKGINLSNEDYAEQIGKKLEVTKNINKKQVISEYLNIIESVKKRSEVPVSEQGLLKSGISKKDISLIADPMKKTANKIDEFSKEVKENITEGYNEATKSSFDSLGKSLLGPLNLITDPLQQITGVNLFGVLANRFLIKEKSNPSKKDLSKTEAGQATLYHLKMLGKEEGKKDKDGFLSKIASSLFGPAAGAGILKAIGAGSPIIAIGVGLIWTAIDAIRGIFASKKWGVSKVSGGIGAALGGMSSGIAGSFKNAGKFALIGAGIGTLVAPGLGTIVGGAAGALIGGLLGFFGGKKIAQVLDKTGAWVNKQFHNFMSATKKHPIITSFAKSMMRLNPFISIIESGINIFKIIGKKNLPVKEKIKKTSLEVFHLVTFGVFRSDGIFNRLFTFGRKQLEKSFGPLKIIDKIKEVAKSIIMAPIDMVLGMVKSVFDFSKSKDKGKFLKDMIDGIKDSVFNFFGGLFNFFGYVGSVFKRYGSNVFGAIGELAGEVIGQKGGFENYVKAKTTIEKEDWKDKSIQQINQQIKDLSKAKKGSYENELLLALQDLRETMEKERIQYSHIENKTDKDKSSEIREQRKK